MTRPATYTSPTHAVGVGMVLAQTAIAVQLLLGTSTTPALSHAAGDVVAGLLPALMLTACLAALAAITVTARSRPGVSSTLIALRVEATAKATLAGMSLAYAASLTSAYGWSGSPTTQTYAWGMGLAFGVRSWQIMRDVRRLRTATAASVPADPPPLGDPTDEES